MLPDKNIEKMIYLLEEVGLYLEESEPILYTGTEQRELIKQIGDVVNDLKDLNVSHLGQIKSHFLPGATYQEIALNNDWEKAYLEMASDFNSLYHRIINVKPGRSLTT